MEKYFVYILLCTDNSYHTGITNDIDVRLREHQEGYDPKSYTYLRRPVELVFFTEFDDVQQAFAFEKQLKGWSRKKKEAVINGEWEKLPNLSKRKNPNL